MFTILSRELTQAQKDAIELVKAHVEDAKRVGDGPFGTGEEKLYNDALKKGVRFTPPGPLRQGVHESQYSTHGTFIAWHPVIRIPTGFPPPTGINVNMLPFVLGDKESLPEPLQPYHRLVELCNVEQEQHGKVRYLTVQESAVTAQQLQRRPGLHIEAPPLSSDSSGINGPGGHLLAHWGGGCSRASMGRNPADDSDKADNINGHAGHQLAHWGGGCYSWGGGSMRRTPAPAKKRRTSAAGGDNNDSTERICDRPRDGIYMASNTPDSTSVYDALICIEPLPVHRTDLPDGVTDDDIGSGLGAVCGQARRINVNAHGDIEHLRETLAGRETHLLPDAMYWMTDRTPHESLPLQAGTVRQYFRLVTSKVSLWYAEHSTANPKVPLPEDVKLIEGNKFSAYHTM